MKATVFAGWMEAAMLTNRTSLVALVALTTLATVGVTTSAAAEPCFFGGFSRVASAYGYSPRTAAKPRKVYTTRQYDKPISAKPARSYAKAAAKPSKLASEPRTAAKPVKSAAAGAGATSGIGGPALSSVSAPASKIAKPAISAPAEPEASACLTKEYLETGAVMFKDTCTKEWAINATHVSKPAASGTPRACLSKDVHGKGVVMFKDECTKEWAMNTVEQPAQDQ
jgi:hypothetical protein